MHTTTPTTTHPDTFTAYMADVSFHVSGFLDHAFGLNDIADYRYADAFTDGVSARECALLAIQADDIARTYRYGSLPISQVDRDETTEQRTPPDNGTTDTTDNPDNGKESSLLDRSIVDILKEHRPSVRNFNGNRSAPNEYITDGRILLLSEHIRTAGRVKKYRDKIPNEAHHYPRTVPADAIDQVIPDYSDFVYADYFGYKPSGGAMVFKVRDTRQYILIDADLYAIVSDVYSTAPSEYVLVNPDNLSGPAVYHPHWYKRAVYGLIMPLRGKVEHPQLSN